MSPVKEDLISEIIRVSQRNYLGKNEDWGPTNSEAHELGALEWVKNNAATYRKHFNDRLGDFSAKELGLFLKELQGSQKDLNDILKDRESFP